MVPAEVPNEVDQLSGVVDPVMHENLLTLSESIVGSGNNNNDNDNYQHEDIENWLQELFDPNFSATSLVREQYSAVPVSYSIQTGTTFISGILILALCWK